MPACDCRHDGYGRCFIRAERDQGVAGSAVYGLAVGLVCGTARGLRFLGHFRVGNALLLSGDGRSLLTFRPRLRCNPVGFGFPGCGLGIRLGLCLGRYPATFGVGRTLLGGNPGALYLEPLGFCLRRSSLGVSSRFLFSSNAAALCINLGFSLGSFRRFSRNPSLALGLDARRLLPSLLLGLGALPGQFGGFRLTLQSTLQQPFRANDLCNQRRVSPVSELLPVAGR